MLLKLFTTIALISAGLIGLEAIDGQTKSLPFANSHFTDIGGMTIHYRLFEPFKELKGNIIFIHGFAASTFSWRKNMDYFAEKGYRVVAVDMPGYGFSEKQRPVDHSHESRSKLVWELLDSISDQQWILVGHSMGGGTAGYMAAMFPCRTEKLVIANGLFGRMQRTLGRTLGGYLLRFPVFFHMIEGMGKAFYINYERFEPLLSSAYGKQADSCAVKGYVEPFETEGSSVAVFETFLRGFDKTTPDPNKIDMPVLLIWGENDTWVPVEAGHKLNSSLRNSKMEVIPHAGHNPMETHPELFNEILLDFLLNSLDN